MSSQYRFASDRNKLSKFSMEDLFPPYKAGTHPGRSFRLETEYLSLVYRKKTDTQIPSSKMVKEEEVAESEFSLSRKRAICKNLENKNLKALPKKLRQTSAVHCQIKPMPTRVLCRT